MGVNVEPRGRRRPSSSGRVLAGIGRGRLLREVRAGGPAAPGSCPASRRSSRPSSAASGRSPAPSSGGCFLGVVENLFARLRVDAVEGRARLRRARRRSCSCGPTGLLGRRAGRRSDWPPSSPPVPVHLALARRGPDPRGRPLRHPGRLAQPRHGLRGDVLAWATTASSPSGPTPRAACVTVVERRRARLRRRASVFFAVSAASPPSLAAAVRRPARRACPACACAATTSPSPPWRSARSCASSIAEHAGASGAASGCTCPASSWTPRARAGGLPAAVPRHRRRHARRDAARRAQPDPVGARAAPSSSVREDEIASELLGVPHDALQGAARSCSAPPSPGSGGWFYAHYNGTHRARATSTCMVGIKILLIVVLGGLGLALGHASSRRSS